MFTKIATNVVGGAISLIALYVVAKLAYKAGTDVTNMENRYNTMAEKTALMEKKVKQLESSKKEALNEGHEEVLTKSEEPEEMEIVKPVRVEKKGGLLGHLKGMAGIGGKASVLKDLIRDPEGHRMEACVNGDAVDIRIQKR